MWRGTSGNGEAASEGGIVTMTSSRFRLTCKGEELKPNVGRSSSVILDAPEHVGS